MRPIRHRGTRTAPCLRTPTDGARERPPRRDPSVGGGNHHESQRYLHDLRPAAGREPAAPRALLVAAAACAVGPASTGSARAARPRPATARRRSIAADPAVDNTDLYAFVSPERPDYVTFIANWQPFSEPNGGPNFYPFATDARYNINVDSDGDAKPDAIFRWTFKNIDKRGNDTFLYNNGPVTSLDDENLLFRQTYTLESSFNGEPFVTRITDAPVAPSRVGPASMPDYQKLRDQAVITFPGGWKGFAGQADDPFFLDLRVFDLLYGGDLSEVGQDTLAGYNVNTIALQVPFKDVALNERRRSATRSSASGPPPSGQRVRMADGGVVRRLGAGLPAGQPAGQRGRRARPGSRTPSTRSARTRTPAIPAVVKRVTDPEVPKLIEAIYRLPAPADAAQRPGGDLPDRHHHQGERPDQGRPQLAAEQRRRQPAASSSRRRCCG